MIYTFGGLSKNIPITKGTITYSDQYIIPVGKQYFEMYAHAVSEGILASLSINYGSSQQNIYTLVGIFYFGTNDDKIYLCNSSSGGISSTTYYGQLVGIAIDFDKLNIIENFYKNYYGFIPMVHHSNCRFMAHDMQFNQGTGRGIIQLDMNFGQSSFTNPIPSGYKSVSDVVDSFRLMHMTDIDVYGLK